MASYQHVQEDDNGITISYQRKQCGCCWTLLLLASIFSFLNFMTSFYTNDTDTDTDTNDYSYYYYPYGEYGYGYGNSIVAAILLLCWAISTIWIKIEDRGDYLLLRYGPCRWLLCGMGKEKIFYTNIRDYQISKSCFYGFGIPCCTSIKLFNTCSCCCGEMGSCFGHKTIRLSINERPQAQGVDEDGDNCCVEQCCLQCFCGNRGEYIGKGCCCQPVPCCNPCNANCCVMNTIFVSTNDVYGLLNLLNGKVDVNGNDVNDNDVNDNDEKQPLLSPLQDHTLI